VVLTGGVILYLSTRGILTVRIILCQVNFIKGEDLLEFTDSS
jgi:hypothetical protein